MRSDDGEHWIYRGRVIAVGLREATLPDGRTLQIEHVQHPGGAAVAALNARGEVCLLRQYRPICDAWLWELPAGKRDAAEPWLETARRELREEAGLEAARWETLGEIRTTPGFCDEVIHLFLARELTEVAHAREAHEHIEVHWLALEEAWERARRGRIDDAKTLIGLCRARDALAP